MKFAITMFSIIAWITLGIRELSNNVYGQGLVEIGIATMLGIAFAIEIHDGEPITTHPTH